MDVIVPRMSRSASIGELEKAAILCKKSGRSLFTKSENVGIGSSWSTATSATGGVGGCVAD